MWNEIALWQKILKERPDLCAKTIALYTLTSCATS